MISKEVLEQTFEFKFSDKVAEVVDLGSSEAQAFYNDRVGGNLLINSDHLLLGLLPSLDSRIIEETGKSNRELYDAIKFIMGRTKGIHSTSELFAYSGKTAISMGIQEAEAWKENALEEDNLLIGLLSVSGVGADVFETLGVSVNRMRIIVARNRFENEQVKAEPVFEYALDKAREVFLNPNVSTPKKHRMRNIISSAVDLLDPEAKD